MLHASFLTYKHWSPIASIYAGVCYRCRTWNPVSFRSIGWLHKGHYNICPNFPLHCCEGRKPGHFWGGEFPTTVFCLTTCL